MRQIMLTPAGDVVSLLQGDCRAVLKGLHANSIDSIVTDPPYGIRFMGKAWDGADIEKDIQQKRRKDTVRPDGWKRNDGAAFAAGTYDTSLTANQAFQLWTEAWGREAFRVLKPGAHLLCFASTRTYHRMAAGIEDAGFEIRDQIGWAFGSGFPKSHNLDGDWEGWGTALKPAWEPIVVARKPLTGTVAANVAQWGTGALNIAGCRVGEEVRHAAFTSLAPCHGNALGKAGTAEARRGTQGEPKKYIGRWPANLIHDGSPEVLAAFPQSAGQLADASSSSSSSRKTQNVYGAMKRGNGEASAERTYQGTGGTNFAMKPGARRGDSGSAARFFYCAKASKKDRGANNHPTVKPTDLMRYLCRLVTPTGGTVLDPFMGSGSTGKAAVLEGMGFTGIELDGGFFAISRARIGHELS